MSKIFIDTESIIRDFFFKKGFSVSRPVLFGQKRSNLLVLRSEDEIKLLTVYESEKSGWTWNVHNSPVSGSVALVTYRDDNSYGVYFVPAPDLAVLSEENARNWARKDPSRDKEANVFRRVWEDQIEDYLEYEGEYDE